MTLGKFVVSFLAIIVMALVAKAAGVSGFGNELFIITIRLSE